MKANAKPVTVRDRNFSTRNEASLYLFGRIDRKALDKEILKNRLEVFYTNTKDSREFEARAVLSLKSV